MEKKSIREVKGEYRLAEWAGLVRECRHSGLNVMSWCEQKGITTNQFYKWQRKVFDALMEQQEAQIQGTGSRKRKCSLQSCRLRKKAGLPRTVWRRRPKEQRAGQR